MPIKAFLLFATLLIVSGCANNNYNSDYSALVEQNQQRSLHYYVEQLARQLFLTSSPKLEQNRSIAVGTILPITQLSGNDSPPSSVLGQQLQESLVTLAAQAGFSVIEFKTANTVKITDNQDIMLSRTLSEIDTSFNADYYLTGTYFSQAQTLVVNVRLIQISDHNVVAAATDTIPISSMWTESMSRSTNKKASHPYQGLN